MHEPGDQLLTGARFAIDMHRCLAARDAPYHFAQLFHRGRAADEARAADVGCRRVDFGTVAETDRAAHELAQNTQIERL